MREPVFKFAKSAVSVIGSLLSPKFPILAPLATEAVSVAMDATQEKEKARIVVSDAEIRKLCEKQINCAPGQYSKDYVEILTATVSICMNNTDVLLHIYDNRTVTALCETFLRKHGRDYTAREYAFLENNLPGVLYQTFQALEKAAENSQDFQIKWKNYVESQFQNNKKEHEEIWSQLDNHEERISKQEKSSPRLLCQIAELSDYYKSRWNDVLFLDRDNSIELSSVFQLPHYEKEDELLSIRIQTTLDLCNDTNNRILLILGHPGSGKSTLISYLLNKCRIHPNRTIKVFRFSGFESIDWNGHLDNLPQQMLNYMGLDKKGLCNSVLILDGLDEVDMRFGQEALIEALDKYWVKSKEIERFSLFITCRTNRIEEPDRLSVRSVVLSPLDADQMTSFAEAYLSQKGTPKERIEKWISLFQNKETINEVIGIPLLLYIALALNVQIDKNSSLDSIYSQIFSLSGDNSIYYRSAYDNKHLVTSAEAKAIHEFSKRFAEKIWDICPDEAVIEKGTYMHIVSQIIGDEKADLRKLLIGQYFMEGSDGNELMFVHRSMYEYFVAVSIYDSFQKVYEESVNPSLLLEKTDEVLSDVSCVLGLQNLSSYPEIQSYLLTMIGKKPIADIEWWRLFFAGFIEYGLSESATNRRKGGRTGLEEELNRFYNLIWIAREQLSVLGDETATVIQEELSETKLLNIPYEGIVDLHGLNLGGIKLLGRDIPESIFYKSNLKKAIFSYSNLSSADFTEAQLNEAILVESSLTEATFNNADLSKADMRNADLSDCSFQKAVLKNTNLSGADLSFADLSFADFTGANLQGADLSGATIEKTIFNQADLSGAMLSHLNFSGLSCRNALFVHATMTLNNSRQHNKRGKTQ